MNPSALHQYYQVAILPQFGLSPEGEFAWSQSKDLGPDEVAYPFKYRGSSYILIYEDYEGLGRTPGYVEDSLGLAPDQYYYVEPTSSTKISPSYKVAPSAPYNFAQSIFGCFTLIGLGHRTSHEVTQQPNIHVDRHAADH